jgi:hypothetical protein
VNGSAKWDADLAPHLVLIRLRAPDGQNDTLPNPLKVGEVYCGKLEAAEAARKSN